MIDLHFFFNLRPLSENSILLLLLLFKIDKMNTFIHQTVNSINLNSSLNQVFSNYFNHYNVGLEFLLMNLKEGKKKKRY